jgi:hypothetical protein
MTRSCLALFALMATLAAAPAPQLLVPPIPPAHPPTAQSAPVPNSDLRGPQDPVSRGARVGVTDFRVPRENSSMGYAPGSHHQTSSERRDIDTPGLTVRVPLQLQ